MLRNGVLGVPNGQDKINGWNIYPADLHALSMPLPQTISALFIVTWCKSTIDYHMLIIPVVINRRGQDEYSISCRDNLA